MGDHDGLRRFINFNKGITLVEDVDRGGGGVCVEKGSSVNLKIKFINLKKRERHCGRFSFIRKNYLCYRNNGGNKLKYESKGNWC